MKKKNIFLVIVLVLSLTTLACNLTKNITQSAVENQPTEQSDKAYDSSPEEVIEDNDSAEEIEAEDSEEDEQETDDADDADNPKDDDANPSESSSVPAVPWSDDISDFFPEFTGGTIFVCTYESSENAWLISAINVTDEEIAAYKSILIAQGWYKDFEQDNTLFEYLKGAHILSMLVGATEENGTHTLSLYLESEDGTAIGSEENGGLDTSYLSNTIPDTYPIDSIPLTEFSESTLIGATYFEAEGALMFTVVYGVNLPTLEVTSKVKEDIKASIAINGGSINDLGGFLIIGEINGYEYAVSIEDGSEEGYITLLSYLVSE